MKWWMRKGDQGKEWFLKLIMKRPMTMWIRDFWTMLLIEKGLVYLEIMDEGMFFLNKFCGLSE